MNYYFMSFASPNTGRNLGCCIVRADSGISAINVSHRMGCNPGGQVRTCQLSEKEFAAQEMELNRLYTREEMMKSGHRTTTEHKYN